MLVSTALAIPQIPLSNFSAFQLLVAGALLLGTATLLLALSRERRVSVKRSAATDELAVHMVRIAEALERIANQTPNAHTSPLLVTKSEPKPSGRTRKRITSRILCSGADRPTARWLRIQSLANILACLFLGGCFCAVLPLNLRLFAAR